MKTEIAAMRIAREIAAFEANIDNSLGRAGTLLATMAEARVATGSPAAPSQRAFARVAAAQTKLVEARGDLIRAHEDLRRIAETADMPTECPDMATLDGERIAA